MMNLDLAVESWAVIEGNEIGWNIRFRVEMVPKKLPESKREARLVNMGCKSIKQFWITMFFIYKKGLAWVGDFG